MNIENAHIIIRDGLPSPVITVGGRFFGIETKATLLALGIAQMQPLDSQYEEDDEAPIEHRATLPEDPANGRMAPQELQHFTDDPEVVALARKFYALASTDTAKEGDL